MRWLECRGAETFSDEASGGEAHIRYIRMAVCHILFGAVAEVILIHFVAFTPGCRADGGLMAYIHHQFLQYIQITLQRHRLFDEERRIKPIVADKIRVYPSSLLNPYGGVLMGYLTFHLALTPPHYGKGSFVN
jgi:hypothetical protein